MNTLLVWFNSPEWMIVVKTLLHTLWQAGGLALLLCIALRRVATPAARYRLTLGTLAAILGTTLITWAVLNQSTPTPAAPDFASPTTPARKSYVASPVANLGEPSVIAYSTPIAKPAEETRWSGWLALAWLLGSALMLTRAGIQVAGAERLRRSCKPLDDSRITQLLAEAQRALNLTRRIRVAVTDKLTSPAVVGVIVPTLILPLTLLTTLTPEQIRFILLHELAHIRRGDYFANLFQLFIEALLFFNPAVWWISHQVRREREACCDALAIELSGAPVDYARTLLHVAETVLNPPPAAAPAFSDNPREPTSLTDRVQRLLVPGYRPALRLTWRAMLAAIIVGGTLLFLSAVGARSTVGAVLSPKIKTATEASSNPISSSDATKPTGILTEAQFRNALRTIEQRSGVTFDNDAEIKFSGDRHPLIHMPWIKNGLAGYYGSEPPPPDISLRAIDPQSVLNDVPFIFSFGVSSVSTVETNSASTTNQLIITKPPLYKGKGRASISNKLDQITFDRISFDHQSWTNVIKTVSDRARKLDPDKRGVNLILNPTTAATASSTNAWTAAAPEPPLVYVSVKPELTNATLRQVLDAIVKGADKPIVFHIEEYAVVISLRGHEIVPLETRMFQVDTDTFYKALESVTGLISDLRTNKMEIVHAAVRKFFHSEGGVNLDPSVGKTVFFNDRECSLFVRATNDELDIVKRVILMLNFGPPQVNIKIRWVEIPQKLMTPAWLNAHSNAFLFPLTNPDVTLNILTEAQTADVLERINQRNGFHLLNEGQVTTLTERQAQISISEAKGVVASINPKALTKPGVVSTNKDGADFLKMETISLGPVFDVIPTVSADEDTISLQMTVTLTEFLGYNKAEKEVTIYVDGKKRKTTLPLPIYRVRQITQNPVVTDGTTMILGNLPTRETAKQPNGEYKTTDVTSTQTNLLFVLVTPTVIDPNGNRAKPAPRLNR